MFAVDCGSASTIFKADICLIEAAPERVSSAVTLQPDWKWDGFMDSLVENHAFSHKHVSKVRQAWARIRLHVGNRLPVPVTQPTADGALQLYWNANAKYLELDVYADGTVHWFFKDDETGELDGTDDDREPDVGQHVLSRLVSLVG